MKCTWLSMVVSRSIFNLQYSIPRIVRTAWVNLQLKQTLHLVIPPLGWCFRCLRTLRLRNQACFPWKRRATFTDQCKKPGRQFWRHAREAIDQQSELNSGICQDPVFPRTLSNPRGRKMATVFAELLLCKLCRHSITTAFNQIVNDQCSDKLYCLKGSTLS